MQTRPSRTLPKKLQLCLLPLVAGDFSWNRRGGSFPHSLWAASAMEVLVRSFPESYLLDCKRVLPSTKGTGEAF